MSTAGAARTEGGSAFAGELVERGPRMDFPDLVRSIGGRPLLLIAAEHDSTVPPAIHFEPFVEALQGSDVPWTAHLLPDDHNFSSDRSAYSHAVVEWLEKGCGGGAP